MPFSPDGTPQMAWAAIGGHSMGKGHTVLTGREDFTKLMPTSPERSEGLTLDAFFLINEQQSFRLF